MLRQTPFKIRKVLVFRQGPKVLGEGKHAGKDHVLDLVGRWHVLGPDVSLSAEDIFGFVGRKLFWNRVEAVNFFEREVTADVERLVRGVALAVIEIGDNRSAS